MESSDSVSGMSSCSPPLSRVDRNNACGGSTYSGSWVIDEPVSAPSSLITSFIKALIIGFFDLLETLMIVELFRLAAFNSSHAGTACTLCVSPPSLVRSP